MVAGEVRAPYVPLANERIDRRHAHSVALAAFFRHYKYLTGEEWRYAGEFFLPGPGNTAPPSRRVPGFPDPGTGRRPAVAVPGPARISPGGDRPGHRELG